MCYISHPPRQVGNTATTKASPPSSAQLAALWRRGVEVGVALLHGVAAVAREAAMVMQVSPPPLSFPLHPFRILSTANECRLGFGMFRRCDILGAGIWLLH